ncbi:winged helix-turn-helix domain-containing protein [Bacillus sp. 1P06AnD]|uniref:winged helix-turn-helix domain-containing protein n=1 Tax=Bacillus sp. 1P06AnD TaxID=3132208 RepID=UPI0039A2648F
MHTIYLIEDDPKITHLLADHLKKYDYEVVVPTAFEQLKQQFQLCSPSLVLLDINLPKYDGFYWCRQFRTISNCPIIFISARAGEMDQVMAIENGGDDYITKPFHFEVVMAKVKSLLRRTYGEYASAKNGKLLEIEGLSLAYDQHSLSYKTKTVDLSKREFTLVESFLENPGKVISRDDLLDRLWDDVQFVDDNTLSVNITRVRKKLAELGINESIETIRGIGYKLSVTWRD